MITNRKKVKGFLLFFRSLIPFTLGIGLMCALLAISTLKEITFISVVSKILFSLPVGTIFGLLYKELAQQEQYYFYYNIGLNKIELWGGSVLLPYSFYFIFLSLISVL